MDFTDSNSGWIWAIKNGAAIASNSASADINLHSKQGDFTFDLTKARGGDSLNPFQAATATGTAAGGTNPTSASSPNGSGAGGDQSSGDQSSQEISSGSSSGGGGEGSRKTRARAVIAHGTIMGAAFALFFPIGAVVIRLFSFPGLVWVHAATQMFSYAVAVVGMGLGIYIAVTPSQYQQVSANYCSHLELKADRRMTRSTNTTRELVSPLSLSFSSNLF